jgi:hypothetical protein
MSSKLMTVVMTVGIVGSFVGGGALAAPYHATGEVRYFSDTNASEKAGRAAATEGDHFFGDDVSGTQYPQYHGGPKSAY